MGITIGSEKMDRKFNPRDKEIVFNAVRRVLEYVGAEKEDCSSVIEGGSLTVCVEDKKIPPSFSYVTSAVIAYQELLEFRRKHQSEGKPTFLEQEEHFLVKKIMQQRMLVK